ncbi:MAG: chromosome segregation protein SMC [Lachnospiraceae bacterium]|nr:chromosome segregation protein SMC [Lachnospiraceae bacterium]
MYLKSVEIHGFKSFANKLTFNFHNGITAIVGPNGSGKSNVADAVRWVLGEQSAKQLRGSNMQDVIFSGTEMRKPMGYAYVAITLDNSDHKLSVDFEEVTVSRRVYRSGESEYLINGTPCRLKDVYEMFYDTGIGKEGYSIIGQGQIDRILSGKPEERRELFDEAAGIVKFKKRKATALKKLADEQANLVRVNDILAEKEKRVGPLEEQSRVAKEYLSRKEQLKALDVNLFLMDSDKAASSLNELDEKLKIAGADLEDNNQKYSDLKEEFTRVEEELGALDTQIEQMRSRLSEGAVMKERLESQININKEKINSAKSNREHYEEQRESLSERLKAQTEEKGAFDVKKDAIDASLKELIGVRDEARKELNEVHAKIEELNKGIESNKNTIIGMLNERAAIKADLTRFDTMLEQAKIHRAEVQSRLLRVKSEEKEQEDELKRLNDELNEICAGILKTDQEREVMEEQLAEFKSNLEESDRKLSDAQIAYHKEKSRLDTMKNLAERYDGYGSSIKRVMEQKEKNKGILGVVADIITVDREYETAIETALGGNIQNIVTENEEVAKKMIRMLKETKGGRATFMPLTSVKDRGDFNKSEVRDEKGFIGMASELVHADKKYSDVVGQLLGAIVVADHVDNALKMAKKYNYLLRIVTLEGEYLTPGGALAGGAFKNGSNLLGRKREIEELEESVKKSLKKIEEIMDGIENTKEKRREVRKKIEELQESLQEQYIKQNTAQMSVDRAMEIKNETMNGYIALENDNRDVEQQVNEINNSKEEITLKLSESEKSEKELEELIGVYGKELDGLRDKESAHVLNVTDIDLKVTSLERDLEHASSDVTRAQQEIDRINAEIAEVDVKIKAEEQEIEFQNNNILEIEKTLAASSDSKDSDEEAVKKAVEQKEELTRKQKTFFESTEELNKRINGLEKEVMRLTNQKERIDEEQEKRIGYMWNEYEITLSAAAKMRNEEYTDAAAMRKTIRELREAIKGLGDVNVNAIEEFKTLMEEYEFLKGQHDDLVEAEKTLEGIVAELDEAMRTQFTEKFKDIEKEFDKVFKEMFGGGKGSLKLQEDEDILEAGISIVAQPPGKKLQNMMQLSGGEKSLTAIALLFAIQNLKPSPFCLLDEIEAALDESNVGRFAGYLNKLTKHTQFIVITHRRGTMEHADRLYGITMQEKGVSTLVSVSLIDKDLDD